MPRPLAPTANTHARSGDLMQPLLYGELVPWYRLVDPPEDHEEEAGSYRAAFERAISPRAETLLDLGAGGGHNAFPTRLLTDAGYEVDTFARPTDDGEFDECFVCRRPVQA